VLFGGLTCAIDACLQTVHCLFLFLRLVSVCYDSRGEELRKTGFLDNLMDIDLICGVAIRYFVALLVKECVVAQFRVRIDHCESADNAAHRIPTGNIGYLGQYYCYLLRLWQSLKNAV
jgi:hypothetical protein